MENKILAILTAEPQEFSREQLAHFDKCGIELSICGKDGIELMERINTLKPRIVIADLFLKKIDGIGVLRSVINQGENPPEFVMLSSFDSPVLEREVINSGASLFASYPVDTAALAQEIAGLVNGSKKDNIRHLSEAKGDSIEMQVTEILHQIGVPAHIKGYHYLRRSIIMSIETPEIINAVTKKLYPSVAKLYETTSSRVERAIRHAIEVAWDRGDVDVLNSYFGYTIHNGRGKPTNSEFIAMISDKLRLQLKNAG
ncbi:MULTISPECIES: sporulation transcription factor Spo0A [unclassified Ruminococcus]|uniref:sporulation transcription factor Spo0A n=1 Tax=unclassified Ruminococcus TaxID=2608920 RepID=UPI00210A60B8|nr:MULTISPECIES: sporulation transcription factor Spo0A [unclassified Ruminococcus]MCQ4021580.1 sporulation transcription factor Spo0A [Ruminococcus sp. zg-924]MCQ4114025.1 sporulation transcription factor Spo0A [Ruminococcus sp. zg-921]